MMWTKRGHSCGDDEKEREGVEIGEGDGAAESGGGAGAVGGVRSLSATPLASVHSRECPFS